jgi:ribokinase
MTISSDDRQPDKVLLLAGVLEKLRTHDGLTVDRLRSDRVGLATPLMELAAVHRYASVHGVDLPDAAIAVVSDCIREDLGGAQQIIADVILALSLLTKPLAEAGIDGHITRALS